MLKVEDLSVFYGQIQALKSISFEVKQGEVVTLIGANGAGKSTVLKTISGLLRGRNGSSITFMGQDISRMEPHRIVERGLSHVPEGRRIFLQMSVLENLQMGAYTGAGDMEADIEQVFERFPRLRERQRQVAGTLSGGEQQMLAIGRALMSRPKLMMLDEPSMGLAPILIEQIFDIIAELNAAGTTILLVEQNARMALSVAHRGYVLETGRVVLADTAQALLNSDAVKKAYLGG
jgi:branched-chain amino acid transport system ATP-binding protein